MRYLFVFLLVVGLVSCGETPAIEKNNIVVTSKKTDTIQEEVSVAKETQTLSIEKTYLPKRCFRLEFELVNGKKTTSSEAKAFCDSCRQNCGKLEVLRVGLIEGLKITWDEAKEFCDSLGDGWRISSVHDIEALSRDKCGPLGGKKWVSSKADIGQQWCGYPLTICGAEYGYKHNSEGQPKYTVIFVRDI